jgi:hypothetical protein
MTSKVKAFLAALLLSFAVVLPVSANHNTNDNVSIATYDNWAQGPMCFEIHGDRQGLTNVNLCGNWDNRINSLKVNIQSGHCFRFYTGQGYTGTVVLTVYGPASFGAATYNFSSAYDNTISSWHNGVRVTLPSGASDCAF